MTDLLHNLKLLQVRIELKKYDFDWEKRNFDVIANSELLALGKALRIYMNYSMFSPSRQHVK